MVRRTATYNVNYFECIDTPDKAYWLGFIAADGYLYKSKKQVFLRVVLSSKDSNHLSKLAVIFGKEVKFLSHIDKRTNREYYQCRLTVFSDLLYINLLYHTESLVDTLSYINSSLHKHFLRGYFDGDGSVSIDYQDLLKFGFCSPDVDFLKSIMNIVCFNTELKPISILKVGVKNCYEFRWHGRGVASYFYNWLYADSNLYLERKHDVFMSYFIRKGMVYI